MCIGLDGRYLMQSGHISLISTVVVKVYTGT